MAGRGKPRKTICEDTKPPTLPKRPEEDFPQERMNGAGKVQKKKKSPSEKSPQEETTNHQRAHEDPSKAPAKDRKSKTCTGKTKTTQQSTEGITKTKPEASKGTANTLIKASKEKTIDKEKLSHLSLDETTKRKPETPRTTKKDSIKATKAKPCDGEAKLPRKSLDETTKMKPEAPKTTKKDSTKGKTAKARGPPERVEDEAAVDSVLFKTVGKLVIKKKKISEASKAVNNLMDDIVEHMKKKTNSFKEVGKPLPTGSYYEKLKISDPDEFDVMLPIPVDRVAIEPFGDDGAFYSVGLKRGKSPLQKFQEEDTLSASQMLHEFREEVKKCAKKHPEWEMTRKKVGCPAVTLTTTVQSVTISLDVVLSLQVKSSWPSFTAEGLRIERWLGTKVRQRYMWEPYYLVPKFEGRGNVENNGVLAKDVWRVSFSHIEKEILRTHGSEKTCCEREGSHCCRKNCLKLLKHLLSRLKEQDSSFDKFCSYHAKTTLLHACCTRTKDTEWRASDLKQCFLQLLDDFVAHLNRGLLPNFFIPSQNLLSGPGKKKCTTLAARIKEERDNGFPIFR